MSDQPERINSGGSDPSHLTKDGQPDRRFKEHGGGQHGNQGGRETGYEEEGDGTSSLRTETQPDDEGPYKPKLHGGVKKDGEPDQRLADDHGFAGDRERASKEGTKGGSASYDNGGLEH